MIHDILVHVPTERLVRPVVDASVSLAAGFGAHLDAVAIGYVSASSTYVMDGGAAAAVAAVFEMERERAAQRAAAALEMFEIEARTAGISYQSRASGELPGDAAASIGTAARLYDLAVVLQPDTGQDTFDNTIPREILFQSGGPVLFVPHIFRGAFKAKRINGAQDVSADASSEELAKHLVRARLPIRLIDLPATRSGIQPSILSLAADESLDMLVMGAYGHSRLQEGILGGVTREMLDTMTVPTLMSH